MNLVDTHTHLYWDSFQDDLDEIIGRSISAGINTIINVGVDVKLSRKALKQVQDKFSNIPKFNAYSTIGIHPHEATKFSYDQIEELEKIYQSAPEKVVAIGECGLDYSDPSEMKDIQKKLLQAQITLAKKLNLPVIIHCRDAWADIFEFIDGTRGILHCYSGDIEVTKKALQTDYLISFAGNLTYPKNEYLREVAKLLPLEKIVLETDCPFLPPQSKRGQRNEPDSVLEIAQLIAQLKDISSEEVAAQTTANAGGIFAF